MISTIVICILIAAICVYSVISCRKKLRNGCCGGGCCTKKIRPEISDKSRYPYKSTVYIDGMTCQNCAASIENAFNSRQGMMAEVNPAKKCAVLWTMQPVQEQEIRAVVGGCGYKFVKIGD